MENLQVLSLNDLLDLLVISTMQMHDITRQKETDVTLIRNVRKDVQSIQSAILKKKSVNSVSLVM